MKLKKVTVDDQKWWIRPDTIDEYVLKEARSYGKRVDFKKHDVWLDAGANIGAFTCRVAKKVSSVVAVEPAPDNLEVLEANIKLHKLDNVTLLPVALVGERYQKTVPLFLNQARNPGSHSQFVQRGRTVITVPTVNVNDVIKNHFINKIKMDVEGAEYGIIMGILDKRWSEIQEFVFEYHFAALKDKHHLSYRKLRRMIKAQGFTLSGPKWNEAMKNWHCLVHAARP